MTDLPQYRSHKIVRAAKIKALELHIDGSAVLATDAGNIAAPAGWADRWEGSEEDKGYYVVYDDSYTSWSPTKTFEEGYTRV